MDKEQIYDSEIHPLMKQIITICKKYGIAMLANYVIPSDTDGYLESLTVLPDETGKVPDRHIQAVDKMRPEACTMTIKVTSDNGNSTIETILQK